MLPNRKSAGLARVISRSRNSIYPAVSRNDNHCGYGVPPETQSRFFTASDVNIKTTMQEILEVRSAGHEQQRHWERGRRRTRQDQISLGLEIAGEIAELRDPHRTKKTDFFCRTGFRKTTSSSNV